ncbi:T9SS type A sorting domain-containing protein [Ferruginibacter sp. SUN106]|uniref:T9SS type A sorting domain-containing protein n=1 Tax=Ferruginibacter sp. SUN106 TaxID=2978348 RepID=UPI003D36D89E
MKKYVLVVIMLLCYWQNVFCQNVPGVQTSCTTSSQGTAGKFVISYTIGEMPMVQSWQSNGLLITQGIIQPLTFIADTVYECFSHTEVKVYPNPNPGIFSLQLSILKPGSAKIILFDATGRQIQQDEFDYITFTTRQYNIMKLAAGIYYLQLFFTEAGNSKAKKCIYTIQKSN